MNQLLESSLTDTAPLAPFTQDAEAAARRKRRRIERFHSRYLPRLRIVGMVLVAVLVGLRDALVEPEALLPHLLSIHAVLLSYAASSWLALRRGFHRFGRERLAFAFNVFDVVVLLWVLSQIGATDSWWTGLLLIKIVDQLDSGMRRTLLFTFIVTTGYVGLCVLMASGSHSLPWSQMAVTASFFLLVGSYLAVRARTSEQLRLRTSAAVNAARQLVRRLELQNTELEERSIELQESQRRAEAANRAKSDFLANISHEIRTPMNGVLGMTDLALDAAVDGEQRSYLRIARSSAESLLSLLNDILDFSKIEAGKLTLEPIEFDLRDTVSDTMAMVGVRARQKGLACRETIASEVPERLVGDPGRLRQLLINLLGNAIKFTERGEVEVRVWPESLEEAVTQLQFEVRDTGIGIAKEKQTQVFEAFTQADATTTREFGGSGLGLAISKQLVQLMGGEIWVESTPGEGSRFRFTLPFQIVSGEAHEPTPISSSSLQLRRILLIEVEEPGRITESLRTWGVACGTASSSREAAEEIQRARSARRAYELIVIDAKSHNVDGFALAKQLRTGGFNPQPDLPIVFLAGDGERGDAARCKELGIAAYLTTPIRPSELVRAIRIVLGLSPEERGATLITRHHLRRLRPSLRVLLAEDNRINQKLAVSLLEKGGYHVSVANNGREALSLYQTDTFDAVLMDVQMPEMDGHQATARIRQFESETGQRVPIIAMTAHAMKGDRERCLESGMDDYLAKPIRSEKLYETLDRLLQQKETKPAPSPAVSSI